MGYKTYPEYRDSGVQWLGEVPAHWEVRRLKFVARYQNSNVDKKSYEGQKNVRLCNYTDVYYNEKITNNMDFMVATATDAEIKSMSLKEGGVVITKDSEDPTDIGVPALVSEPLDNVVCGYHLTVLRAKNQDAARYLHRVIQSHPTRAHFFVESPGVTRFGLNQDAIGGLVMPVPPIVERKKIAAFLDEKTTQIDQLIEKKTRFIELLKEKRAALITEAVTGKFDVRTGKPYAEYKDLGVEWLGEVPAHWKVKRLKFLIRCLDGKRIPLNSEQRADIKGNIPYWGSGGIVDYINQYLFDEELILLGEDGAPFFDRYRAVAYLASGKIWVNNHIHVLRNISDIPSVWIVHALNCVEYHSYIGGSTRDKLTQDDMKEIALPVPSSFIEIKSILAFLDRQTARIDKLIDKTQHSINLLKEKRAALITAVVTGKIDVRNWNTEAA